MDAFFFIAYPFYAIITTYIILEDYDKALELDKKMPLACLGNALLYYDYISWSALLHLAVIPDLDPVQTCSHTLSLYLKKREKKLFY
jgi:hypothetical protein